MDRDQRIAEGIARLRLKQRADGAGEALAAYRRIAGVLGPEQLQLTEDPRRLVAACCGRRAGKSTSAFAKCNRVAARRADAQCCLVGPTIKQAVSIFWDDIARWNEKLRLGWTEHWSWRQWTRAGATIDFAGFANRKEAGKLRGGKYDFVDIDEAQLGPEWFGHMIEEGILPTLLDYGGDLWMTGTPGLVADGFFFNVAHDTSGAWSRDHHWTAEQNPFFAGRNVFEELARELKLQPGTPKYQREWLGLWVIDADELVYRIPDKALIPSGDHAWAENVGGLDLGFRDADALSIIGLRANRTSSHLRHAEAIRGQTTAQLLAMVLQRAERFDARTWVCDAGGLGLKIVESLRSEAPRLTWIAADKARKLEYVELLNSDMEEGKHTVEPGVPVIQDALKVRWAKAGKIDEAAFHSDLCDGWLYPWRYVRNSLRELQPKKVADPSGFSDYKARINAAKERQRNPYGRM